MSSGTLKTWKEDKGFGFLASDNPNEPDIFVHITAFQKAGIKNIPQPGDKFSYEIGEGREGKKQAVGIVKI